MARVSRLKYFHHGRLSWDENSPSGLYVKEKCKRLDTTRSWKKKTTVFRSTSSKRCWPTNLPNGYCLSILSSTDSLIRFLEARSYYHSMSYSRSVGPIACFSKIVDMFIRFVFKSFLTRLIFLKYRNSLRLIYFTSESITQLWWLLRLR